MRIRILVIDDEESVCDILKFNLEKDGYEVDCAYSAEEALEKDLCSYSIFIVDIMMGRLSGFDFAKHLKNTIGTENTPIIFCSALDHQDDKVMGLNMGGDDYITKPFNPLEVIARVKTQLRRYKNYNQAAEKPIANMHDIRGLVISKETHICTLYGKQINLTPLEFSILWYLCEHKGKVVSSEELFEEVWGEKYLNNSNNTVMAHIGRLREKLKEPAKHPKFIKTVWGVGYKIED